MQIPKSLSQRVYQKKNNTQTDYLPLSLIHCILSGMTRKLTHQQQRRIATLHDKRRTATQTDEEALIGEIQTGLLIVRHGRSAFVENDVGELIHCHLRQNLADVVAGDQVCWQATVNGGNRGVIVAVLPRKTVYTKLANAEGKVLAANMTCLVVVFAPEPCPTPGLLDKYLIAAELSLLKTIFVLNKCDLLPDFPLSDLDIYRDLGYPILEISTLNGTGFDKLQDALRSEISLIVGQSGVGKSSLIQRLLPESDIRIGAISEATGFGRHTTSSARFYHLSEGGAIIDSPGVRNRELGSLTQRQVELGFIECRDLIGQCKFRDCTHEHEPGCAVIEAMKTGKMSVVRYERLLSFLRADTSR
ncbi:MAG: ribosome small subunit-dependent GTPase A [Legionellales bacterium]|nr:ribosome small subunit-dependent GTPase A [Legionellales bacterium]